MNDPASPAVYKSVRINVLLGVAYVTVILCLIVTVWFIGDDNQYAQGIITLVLGRFLGYTDSVYSFEFGTTRDNKVKDESISNLTAAAVPTTTRPERRSGKDRRVTVAAVATERRVGAERRKA